MLKRSHIWGSVKYVSPSTKTTDTSAEREKYTNPENVKFKQYDVPSGFLIDNSHFSSNPSIKLVSQITGIDLQNHSIEQNLPESSKEQTSLSNDTSITNEIVPEWIVKALGEGFNHPMDASFIAINPNL